MFGLDVDKNIISYVVLLKFTMCVTAWIFSLVNVISPNIGVYLLDTRWKTVVDLDELEALGKRIKLMSFMFIHGLECTSTKNGFLNCELLWANSSSGKIES